VLSREVLYCDGHATFTIKILAGFVLLFLWKIRTLMKRWIQADKGEIEKLELLPMRFPCFTANDVPTLVDAYGLSISGLVSMLTFSSLCCEGEFDDGA
jgi:hypothetical protein